MQHATERKGLQMFFAASLMFWWKILQVSTLFPTVGLFQSFKWRFSKTCPENLENTNTVKTLRALCYFCEPIKAAIWQKEINNNIEINCKQAVVIIFKNGIAIWKVTTLILLTCGKTPTGSSFSMRSSCAHSQSWVQSIHRKWLRAPRLQTDTSKQDTDQSLS